MLPGKERGKNALHLDDGLVEARGEVIREVAEYVGALINGGGDLGWIRWPSAQPRLCKEPVGLTCQLIIVEVDSINERTSPYYSR